ncbi:MAG: RNA polymerase sigma factor [Planctomycetia bacterium]|nr:RNA polymerase sigma factor [Planctomycetia bacterium]MCC7314687.1 RNA polymerase sigma factor [Planctomycetota bacterium]
MKLTRDSEGFLQQLEPLRHQLYGYAHRALNRSDQVADVLQETVMTAWREYPRFLAGTNFRAWVFRIMVNTIFTFNKRTGRERTISDVDTTLDVEAVLEHESEWALILEEPSRLQDILDERLVQALDDLGPNERQCFLLGQLQEFSYKDIADMLDLPLGTVMSHVHRARIKLRERLASFAIERRYISGGRP